jgi:hypothetical protein
MTLFSTLVALTLAQYEARFPSQISKYDRLYRQMNDIRN